MTSPCRLLLGLLALSLISSSPVASTRAPQAPAPRVRPRPPTAADRPVVEHAGRQIGRYGIQELTVTYPTAPTGNCFVDVPVSATLTGPDGRRRAIAPFCDSDDGRVFRVRFLPTQVGRYTYDVAWRLPSEGHESGSFDATAGPARGLLRIDPQAPAHFMWEGTGDHFFWNSTTAYFLLGWRDPAVIRQAVDRLARLGVNRIRVALSGRTQDGLRWREPDVMPTDAFQFRLTPWPAARPDSTDDPGYDVSRFDLAYFRKAERMLEAARARDMIVSLIFHLDGADRGVDPFGKDGMGGEAEQRYYRYVIARLGAYANVTWDITNEWHLFRNEAWVHQMGELIRRHDPYGHLISAHGSGTFPFRTAPWADFAAYQKWDEGGGYDFMVQMREEQARTGRPLPQVNEEYGYEDHYPYPWGQAREWPARTADTRRRLAWEITMAGGYQTTGERANVPGQGGWITGRGEDTMTMLEGYRHLRTFFEGLPWWQFAPRPDLLVIPPAPPKTAPKNAPPIAPLPALRGDPMLLAGPAHIVVYLPRGGTATVGLPSGTWQGRWVNPRNGAAGPAVPGRATGRWTSSAAPDALDWVLLLVRR